MISQATANRVMVEAMKTGADFAEIFMEDRDNLSLSMLDGQVENVSTAREYGAGIRILYGDRSIYVYTNDTSEASLIQAATEAAAALGNQKNATRPDSSFAAVNHRNRSPIRLYPSDIMHPEKIELLMRANRIARGVSNEISQVSAGYADVDQKILVCNSEGLWTEDRRIRTRIMVSAVASDGREFQTGSESPGRSMGFEMFSQEVDVEEISKMAAQQAITMLHAEECPAGVVPVVIDSGFGGVIFHEACGHALEATAVAKGNSVFCDMLDKPIAAPCVSAVDDGTIPNAWGTLNMDDEGHATQKNQLIENGILKGYLIDRLGSRRMNMPSTGSGRRQNYTFTPTSRMNNTFICAGTDSDSQMLHDMPEGLYAKSMGGGSVNPLTGEFNFAVREGYWVKNGDMRPVRGATLIGKGADVLMKIDRVGKHVGMGTGMCGSISGSIPTNVGQPRIRVSEMIVGGKGGALS